MRSDKGLAIRLRMRGNSYSQISKKLNIPKSTLSYWLKSIKLSKNAKNKIQERVNKTSIKALIKRNKQQTVLAKKRAEEVRSYASKEVKTLARNKLFITGVSLYWAEGYKKGAKGSKWKSVDFANSDAAMIEIMMEFFREICGVENQNIKLQLISHSNVDVEKAVSFWSGITKIPRNQFTKTCCSTSKSSKSKRKNDSLPNGTLHIRINNVSLFFRIIGWIDGFKKYMGL